MNNYGFVDENSACCFLYLFTLPPLIVIRRMWDVWVLD